MERQTNGAFESQSRFAIRNSYFSVQLYLCILVHSPGYTVLFILSTVQSYLIIYMYTCTVSRVHCTVCTIHCPVIPNYIYVYLYTLQGTLFCLYYNCTVSRVHCTVCTIQCPVIPNYIYIDIYMYTLHSPGYTVLFVLSTVQLNLI